MVLFLGLEVIVKTHMGFTMSIFWVILLGTLMVRIMEHPGDHC